MIVSKALVSKPGSKLSGVLIRCGGNVCWKWNGRLSVGLLTDLDAAPMINCIILGVLQCAPITSSGHDLGVAP